MIKQSPFRKAETLLSSSADLVVLVGILQVKLESPLGTVRVLIAKES